jgi:hypothetical protein
VELTLPLKIKIFTWQLARGRLPSNDHIHAWGGPSDGLCALCGQLENADHIFFNCILAQFLLSGVRDMFRVNWNPRSRQQWFQILDSLSAKSRCFVWIFFAAQCWTLWTTRNKFTIEKKFPRQPADCIFKITLSLQLWCPLQRPKDLVLLDEMVALSKALFARTYSAPPTFPSLNVTRRAGALRRAHLQLVVATYCTCALLICDYFVLTVRSMH